MVFNKPVLVISIATVVVTAGCQNMTKQQAGTGIGAATGGIVGAIFGDTKGALIGAAAGGLFGNLIGSHLDRQEKAIRDSLQQEIQTGDVVIHRPQTHDNDVMVLSMNDTILFDMGSAVLKPGAHDQLNKLIQSWQANPEVSVMVTGHTDNVGSLNINRELSLRRAGAVTNYLIAHSFPKQNIYSKGAGELSPIADNNNDTGRKTNRRVDLVFFPTGKPIPEVIPLVSHDTEPVGMQRRAVRIKEEFTSNDKLPTIPELPGTMTATGQPPKIPEPSDVYAFDNEHRMIAMKRQEIVETNEGVSGVTPPTIPSF